MLSILQTILRAVIVRDDSRPGRIVYWCWAILMYATGALAWGKFLNWGQGPYDFHDWAEVTMPRLLFLQDAAQRGLAPLHTLQTYMLGSITDRFQTIPDVMLSPQYLLLSWMDNGAFILFNFLLLYTVGFAGLLWLGSMKRLSPMAMTALVLLFNFNGHMMAHFAVGHYTWVGSFFFPWLLGLIFQLLEGQSGWKWALKVSVLLFVMLLQGGYHQFIWSLFLLALLIPAAPRHFFTLARALIGSVLLSMVRVLPAVLNLGTFDNKYLAGYNFVESIWNALVNPSVPDDYTTNMGLTQTIGTWENTLYIGIAAVLFVLGFGVVQTLRERHRTDSLAALLLPALGLTVLSLDSVYRFLRASVPLPLFTGERVATRIFFLAFFLMLTLAVIEFQRWAERQKNTPVVVLSSGMIALMMASDAWKNSRLWRISAVEKIYGKIVNPADSWIVANHSDPVYLNVLWIGAAVSLVTLAVLIWMTVRSERKAAPANATTGVPARKIQTETIRAGLKRRQPTGKESNVSQ